MPVDFSTLMSSPPVGFAARGWSGKGGWDKQSWDPDLLPAPSSPFACRRFQSFPLPAKAAAPCKAHSDLDLVLTSPIIVPCAPFQDRAFPEFSSSAPSKLSVLALGLPSLAEQETSSAPSGLEALVFTCDDDEPSSALPDEGIHLCEAVEELVEAERRKKSVVFADEAGGALFEVRVMSEPSDVPPKLDRSVLRALLGEAACEEARPCATWFLAFPQPASDYLAFRNAVQNNAVALENAILRNEECSLQGTIKVKNVCFHKEVFVRVSADNWKTYKDHPATYVPSSPSRPGASAALDTFSFRLQVPCDDDAHRRLDFAVCFREGPGGTEHWDSRQGKNFHLLSQKAGLPALPSPPTRKTSDDAFQLHHHNWPSFSVLHDIHDSHPYY